MHDAFAVDVALAVRLLRRLMVYSATIVFTVAIGIAPCAAPATSTEETLQHETLAAVGFESADCDRDFRAVAAQGARVLEKPTDRPRRAGSAYIRRARQLTFELEQGVPEG